MKVLLPGVYRVEATVGNCRSSGLLRLIIIDHIADHYIIIIDHRAHGYCATLSFWGLRFIIDHIANHYYMMIIILILCDVLFLRITTTDMKIV